MAITTFQVKTNPTNGFVTGFNPNTGICTYTPNLNYVGLDTIVYYILCDGLIVDEAIHTITIQAEEIQGTINGTIMMHCGTTYTIAFTQTAGSTVSSYVWSVPPHLTIVSGQGTSTITVLVNNSPLGDSIVNLTVGNPITKAYTWNFNTNCAKAKDDFATSQNWEAVNLMIASNDTLCGSTTTFEITSNPLNGNILSFNPNTGSVQYKPNAGFVGTDQFTYVIKCNGVVIDQAVGRIVSTGNCQPSCAPEPVCHPPVYSSHKSCCAPKPVKQHRPCYR